MQHNLLIVIPFLIATSLCSAMESTTKALSCVKKPTFAKYITGTRALMRSREKSHSWYLVDPINNTNLRKITDCSYPTSHLALHPNKETFVIGEGNVIKIFDAEGNQQRKAFTWGHPIGSTAFDTSDDNLFLSQDGHTTRWNYKKESQPGDSTIIHNLNEPNKEKILYHPKKSLMCFTIDNADITFLNKNNLEIENCYKNNGFSTYDYYTEDVSFTDNPDKTIIPYFTWEELFIINIDSGERTKFVTPTDRNILAVASHPNNNILITLAKSKSLKPFPLTYYDISTQKCIHEHDTPFLNPNLKECCAEYSSLSIAPDGKHLMITAGEECIIIDMSEIIK